ncbi:MAG: DoxX family protein [Candidatus Pacearchaeota archaeon]
MSDTKQDKELGPLFLRIGLALTLIFSLVTKFGNTEKVVGMMGKLGLNFASSPGVVTALGIILLISAALLIFGLFTRQNAIFLTVFFAVTVLTGISAGILSAGPAIWKDFGLLGGALALVFLGAGSYSIDKKRS